MVCFKWHQINSVKKICGTERQQKKLFEPGFAGEFFFCSGVEQIFRNLFAALTFCFFCVKTKESLRNVSFRSFLEFIPMKIGAKKRTDRFIFKVRASGACPDSNRGNFSGACPVEKRESEKLC